MWLLSLLYFVIEFMALALEITALAQQIIRYTHTYYLSPMQSSNIDLTKSKQLMYSADSKLPGIFFLVLH